ncbi:MAG: ATP-binding protein, partial [Spirochaetes bacterium]|nr:ATP-binding protein [Spirochaetota bacterium]
GSQPIDAIAAVRPPRYVFLQGSATFDVVSELLAPGTWEAVFAPNYDAVYQILRSGEADALIEDNIAEAAFDQYGGVIATDFLPLVFSTIAMSTKNPKLAPIISVVTKALQNGAAAYLAELYQLGYQDYRRHKFFMQLTEEEREFLQNPPVIRLGVRYFNYPVTYYNTFNNRWEGMAFDVLRNVEELTGLRFEVSHGPNTTASELLKMLENGSIDMLPDFMRTPQREGRFIWADYPLVADRHALLSKWDFPNISINDIPHANIGLIADIAHTEVFWNWFPRASNITMYATTTEAFHAMDRGEVDLVMASKNRLRALVNYYALSDHKANIMFSSYYSTFGFNNQQAILASIISKALPIVGTAEIAEQWLTRTFDYQARLLQAQRPWFIGGIIAVSIILVLVSVLLILARSAGKQLERLVKQRTTTLQAIIDSIPDMIYCRDKDLKFTLCNVTMMDYFGVDNGIIGKNIAEFGKILSDIEESTAKADEIVLNERRTVTKEEWLPSADGSQRLFETIQVPFIFGDAVDGIIGISRDITRRKEIEKELERQSSVLQMIIDCAPGIIFCMDLKLNYTLCNKYMIDYFGVNIDHVIGKGNLNGFGLSAELAELNTEMALKVINEGRSVVYEEWLPSFDGTKRLFETIKSPLMQGGVISGIVGISSDITERKAMEEQARAASRSKSEFLAVMSHEMRTPMNVIVGLTDLMLEETDLPAYTKENLKKISIAGNTLLRIINDVLDISKIEAGKLELMPVQYELPGLLNDIITFNVMRIQEKPVTFCLEINENLLCNVYGDDLRVKQIINNLLSNAFKYTQKGTITLGMSCEFADNHVWLSVCVADTGIGIRKEDQYKLFTDYIQVDTRANRRIEGTGLGLSITKRLVELMDGEIAVESEYGKGTAFKLRIRQGFVDNTPIGPAAAENLRKFRYTENKQAAGRKLLERPDLSFARVLVVDDMQINLDVASGLLRKYKMQVDCVLNGKKAIELIRCGKPVYNAIFMDHMMPEMDGIETANTIRAIGTEYARKIPVVALTANAIQGTEDIFYAHGFQAFLSKPIDIMQLDSIIKKLIHDKK